MLDSHHYLLGKLSSPIFLCFVGLEGKPSNHRRNQDEIKLLDCYSVVRCDEGVVHHDEAKVPQLKKLRVRHEEGKLVTI